MNFVGRLSKISLRAILVRHSSSLRSLAASYGRLQHKTPTASSRLRFGGFEKSLSHVCYRNYSQLSSKHNVVLRKNSKLSSLLRIVTRSWMGSSPKNNSEKITPTMMVIAAVALLYGSCYTLLLKYYANYRYPEEETLPEKLRNKPDLYKFLFKTMQESHLEDAVVDCTQIFFKSDLAAPTHLGSHATRQGANIYLPSWYMAEDINEIDVAKVCQQFGLDMERLESDIDETGSTSMLEALKGALYLSFDARRFGLLLELHRTSQPILPYFDTISLAVIPISVNQLGTKFALGPSIAWPLIGLSYVVATFLIGLLQRCQHRYGLWAVTHYEIKRDPKAIDENLERGALEYYEKLKLLYKIIYKYSKNKCDEYQLDATTGNVDRKDFLQLATFYPLKKNIEDLHRFLKQSSKGDSPVYRSLSLMVINSFNKDESV